MYKKLGILKLRDMLYVNIASLMWDFDHGSLPSCFNDLFHYTKDKHGYSTRAVTKNLLSTELHRTKLHGEKSFQAKGTNVLNEIKELSIYAESSNKKLFKEKLKKQILDSY